MTDKDMPTLSEVKEASAKRRGDVKALKDAFAKRARMWPRSSCAKINLEEFRKNDQMPIGIACDICKFELVASPGFPLASNPPHHPFQFSMHTS